MYTRILVPVDGSAASALGLDEAIELARHLKARVRLVHVVEPWVMVTTETMAATVHQVAEGIRRAGTALLKECEKKVANAGIELDSELIETIGGSAGECIVKKAKEVNADLIVCGTHGRRGLRRVLMGSDAEYILRRAPVPVLLVRKQEPAARAEAA
jgi:nucleotide-binding universal stress UspA family protein